MSVDQKPLKSKANKWVIIAMAAFFAIQITFDLCHSVTAYPFEHYGMFSESLSAADSVSTYEIIADGQRLDASDFGIYRWDMIQQPLAAFDRQSRTTDFAADRSRIRAALPGTYSRLSTNLENPPTVAANFPDWYSRYLGRLLRQPIHSLQVNRCRFRFFQDQLILTQKVSWIKR